MESRSTANSSHHW
ncbi:unnamed protein product [Linum tenue]|uniref:Uncharacterized protein n=1 Tax=Linum tenue TaxID=586396 RepID=A0AAV0KX88_9ROSI|nr:unnamed protein product [Linum tenue]